MAKGTGILSSQVVSLPLQSVIQEVANFCAVMDTLTDQDGGQGAGLKIQRFVARFSLPVMCRRVDKA